jgi:1-acyl-sn-glycerol-3-phosphate acyltransferase
MIGPELIHNAPTSGLIKYWLGRCWFGLTGWKAVGEFPPDKKFVIVAAPHTSNWDFPYGMSALFIYRLKTSWMGKDTLFKWPLGVFLRALGGMAIDRSSHHGVVEQTAEQLKNAEQLVIMLAADGTRTKLECWKSGFYWIAHKAQVPIVCGYLDYANKRACVGLSFVPTGNVKQDMDRIREFFQNIEGRKPEKQTPVRLNDE